MSRPVQIVLAAAGVLAASVGAWLFLFLPRPRGNVPPSSAAYVKKVMDIRRARGVQPEVCRMETLDGRAFHLFVPAGWGRGRAAPLIVSCHGTDPFDTAELQAQEWRGLAERHGCIVVCPRLSSTDGILGAGEPDGLRADEKHILSVACEVCRRYDVDRERVMITGFAGGGHPMYFVGLRHPEVFTTVAARSCSFSREALDGHWPPEAARTPVMAYCGRRDPQAIRRQTAEAVKYLRSRGFQVATTVLSDAGHERRPDVAMRFFMAHSTGRHAQSAPAAGR